MKNFLRAQKLPDFRRFHRAARFLGRIKSAFRSRLNRRTILDNTAEAEAYRLYLEELERLPEAMLKKDRAVEHYRQHRDDIIRSDHEQHVRQMRKERMQRQLDAEEDRHKLAMARQRRENELYHARRESAPTKWSLDAFEISLPHRKERIDHLFRHGATDAALDVIAALQELLDEGAKKPADQSRTSSLDEALQFAGAFIDSVRGTASHDQLEILCDLRSQLSARIEWKKTDQAKVVWQSNAGVRCFLLLLHVANCSLGQAGARLFVIGKGLCLPNSYDKLSINLVKSREISSDEFWQTL